ncbi:hypothetical protein INR49_026509 [Caranx melampygus]|nr:hypothetical protein INR49_026509 [Caranx melampygus]
MVDWEMRVPKPPAPPYTLGARPRKLPAVETRVTPPTANCLPPLWLKPPELALLKELVMQCYTGSIESEFSEENVELSSSVGDQSLGSNAKDMSGKVLVVFALLAALLLSAAASSPESSAAGDAIMNNSLQQLLAKRQAARDSARRQEVAPQTHSARLAQDDNNKSTASGISTALHCTQPEQPVKADGGEEEGGLVDLAGGNGLSGRGMREVGTILRDCDVMKGEKQEATGAVALLTLCCQGTEFTLTLHVKERPLRGVVLLACRQALQSSFQVLASRDAEELHTSMVTGEKLPSVSPSIG